MALRPVVDSFTQHAIPTQREFYDELFANGTRANMIMFEQDFLCAISDATTLVNRDLETGEMWLRAMNDAARDVNISLQFCMMNGAHALASTLYSQVTNGRATRDNHPNQTQSTSLNPSNAGNGLVLGLSGMLCT